VYVLEEYASICALYLAPVDVISSLRQKTDIPMTRHVCPRDKYLWNIPVVGNRLYARHAAASYEQLQKNTAITADSGTLHVYCSVHYLPTTRQQKRLMGIFIKSGLLFSDAFVKLRKATISFVTCFHLCTSVRHGTTRLPLDRFWWNLMFELLLWKPAEEIQVSWKSDKNNGSFTWRCFHIYDGISLNSSKNEKCFR
jgi:hypothetical protein